MSKKLILAVVAAALCSCDQAVPPRGPEHPVDAGSVEVFDAGADLDAGPVDAGSEETVDAGEPDAGVDAGEVEDAGCHDRGEGKGDSQHHHCH